MGFSTNSQNTGTYPRANWRISLTRVANRSVLEVTRRDRKVIANWRWLRYGYDLQPRFGAPEYLQVLKAGQALHELSMKYINYEGSEDDSSLISPAPHRVFDWLKVPLG